jgi:hypothetical protein
MNAIRLETDKAALHVVTYVHADILKPGPNGSHRVGAFRGLWWAFVFQAAAALLLWLIVWAAHHWNF